MFAIVIAIIFVAVVNGATYNYHHNHHHEYHYDKMSNEQNILIKKCFCEPNGSFTPSFNENKNDCLDIRVEFIPNFNNEIIKTSMIEQCKRFIPDFYNTDGLEKCFCNSNGFVSFDELNPHCYGLNSFDTEYAEIHLTNKCQKLVRQDIEKKHKERELEIIEENNIFYGWVIISIISGIILSFLTCCCCIIFEKDKSKTR
jgi:hypothetical protein